MILFATTTTGAMSQPDIYTVGCLVIGEDVPFTVEIAKSELVGVLKQLIKEKDPDTFAGIEVNFLDLYHVEITDDDELVANVKAHPSIPRSRSQPH